MRCRPASGAQLSAFLLSCSCGVSPVTSGEPGSPPPDTWAEAAASVVPAVAEEGEGCVDGRDNDHDGLLDCEEASCARSPSCTEVCGNGEDDDNNGLTDELDAACWTPHSTAARITAQVSGGGAIHQQWDHIDEHYSRGWVGYIKSSSTRRLNLASAWGTAQVTTAASEVFNCSWGASGIDFGWNFFDRYAWDSLGYTIDVSASNPIPVSRSLSWVDSGCPVGASSFLPTAFKTSATGQFGAMSSGSLVGRRWYMAAFPYFGGHFSIDRSQDSMGRFRRTERHSTVTGELRAGDPVVFGP